MWQAWSSRIAAKKPNTNNKPTAASALAPTGAKAPSPKNPLFFESQQHQILKNALSARPQPIVASSKHRNNNFQHYNNYEEDDDDDEDDVIFNPQLANFISFEKEAHNSQKDFYEDESKDDDDTSTNNENLLLEKTSPLHSQEKEIIQQFSRNIIASSQTSSVPIGDRMVDDEDNDTIQHHARSSLSSLASQALFTSKKSSKSTHNKKSSSTTSKLITDDQSSDDELSVNDDDFEKYFGGSLPSSLNSSSGKKKQKKASSTKRRKKTTQLPDKISGIYHSDDDQDIDGLNDIMNFDHEDSQPRSAAITTENDSSSSATGTESASSSYQHEFSQPLTPPERTYKATKKKQSTAAKSTLSSSLNTSKYFTPQSSTSKRKSAATLNNISYILPKEIEEEDDIDEFSDDDDNILPVPALVAMGSSGALFSNVPQQNLMQNSAMLSSYIAQQQHVHNNATPKSKSINVDDLIESDSDEEPSNAADTSSEMDQRFSQMVAATNSLSQHAQTTPAKTATVHPSSTSSTASKKKTTDASSARKDLILSGEDGFDLDERLKGIRRKSTRQSVNENEVERLLFHNSKQRKSSSLAHSDDMIEDDNSTTTATHPTQILTGSSWLDSIRKSSKQQHQHGGSNVPGITLSQQSNQGNGDQFFSQWDHLKKILSTRSQGRFVSKLKRAINGGMNEKVFQKFSSEINLSQQPTKEGLVLKILVFNQALSQAYPHLVIGICKIVSRPQSSDNERLDQVLHENDFIDVYFAKEMKEKWNLRPGSIVEISTLFHITPPQEIPGLHSGQPSQCNEPIFIYRPRPVLSYFFEMKCKAQTSDANELSQDIKDLQTKFSYPMLSSSSDDHQQQHRSSMMVDNESNGASLPTTPPRANNKSRTNTPDFLTPSHVRQRNVIATPKRLDFSDNQETTSSFERNYHLISRITSGPLTKKFETVYRHLHSAFFPSYYLNIEGVIQRVWSFDFMKNILANNYKTLHIPQLTSAEAQLSNTVLIQCVSTKSLCILLLPSGDTEYSYWKSIFDYNISQGKVVQFHVCSFKDRVYIGPEDELYSIIAPLYHHNQQQDTMSDSQHSHRSTCSENSSSTTTNPLIPLYFFTTNSQHSTCKYVIPRNHTGMIQSSLCSNEASSLLLDPLVENITPYSSYKHQLFYSFDQPISGDTQQSNGGVEDVTMMVDDDSEKGGELRIHRCDIEGSVLFIKETDQVPWTETQNSIATTQNGHHENTLFTLYLLQKHSSMILKLDSSVSTGSSLLYSVAKAIQQTNREIILQNVSVKRHVAEKEAIHTELILDKFSMLYLPTHALPTQNSSEGEGNTNFMIDLTQTLLPWCVKLRGMDQQKKLVHRMNDSTAVKGLEYEYTCTNNSIGLVEGYVTEVIEEANRGPTISLCPHCHRSLHDHTDDSPNWRETEEGQRMCMHCFATFTKPQFELYFKVKIGNSVVLTLDTLAIQQMFSYKQTTKQNKKLPVSGNETYKQARDLVLNHHLRFLCHCDTIENNVENGMMTSSHKEGKSMTPCYHFSIVHGVKV